MDTPPLPTFVEFAQPAYFALLAVLPVVIYLAHRSLSGLGPVRRKLVVLSRCLVIAVLITALADPKWVRTTDDQTVLFAVDQSDSVPEQQQRMAAAYVEAAAESMRPGKDLVAGVLFAGRPAIWQLPKPHVESDRLPAVRDRHQTDIASTLKIGLGMFPPETARRLVLISDGNENRGLSSEVAQRYAALGIPIDVLPLRYEHKAEILVERLSAPATANRDEVFELGLFVRSVRPSTGRLYLYHNDRLIDLDVASDSLAVPIHLDAGLNRFSIPMQLGVSGVHRFEAVIQPDDASFDTMAVNNRGRTFTIVGQAERVVIVAGARGGEDARVLADALRGGGIEVEEWSIDDLPSDPAALVDCSTLILSNVSALALGERLQNVIASFVRDQGGGLIVVGGDQSFSVGAYARTPLEEVLPVETDRDKLQLLSLGMVIVIDRSGSMAGEKLSLARHAAAGAVKILTSADRIGVMAFDSWPQWVVPVQLVDDKAAISRRISSIMSGGGTNMFPALEQAYQALAELNTNLKHVILLTDGRSTPGDFEGLAVKCREAGITVSTIAVGNDADRGLLSRIASLTQGRMYVAESARPLPQIFVHETILASGSGMYERSFMPQFLESIGERIMVGFSQQDVPALHGHVVTAAKSMAFVPLVRQTDDGSDPILAYWQAGLGRSVAFTSGHWSRWGSEWAAWPGFSKLWTQAVRYAGRPESPAELEVESTLRSGTGQVVVSAEHLSRQMQSSLSLRGLLIHPDQSVEPLMLRQTSLGRFEAEFPADTPGTYLVNLVYAAGEGSERRTGSLRTGVVVSYSREYATLEQNEASLAEIARMTGGRVLPFDRPEMVFESWSFRPVQVRRSVWDLLVQLALALFLFDVAVRRLAINPTEVFQKMMRWIEGLGGRPSAAESVATLATLRTAQDRIRGSADGAQRNAIEPDYPPTDSGEGTRPAKRYPSRTSPDSLDTQEHTPSPPSSDSEEDHMARLLRAKRRARNDRQDNSDA